MAEHYTELVARIHDESPAKGEVVEALAGRIRERVSRYRELNFEIAERAAEVGIRDMEAERETLRGELLPLTREFRDLAESNWEDGVGYARYAKPGESHTYPVAKVDEAAAAIATIVAEIEEAVSPQPEAGEGIGGVDIDRLKADDKVTAPELFGVIDLLASEIVELRAHLESMQRDVSLSVEGIEAQLKRLAASRKVSTSKESVRVV